MRSWKYELFGLVLDMAMWAYWLWITSVAIDTYVRGRSLWAILWAVTCGAMAIKSTLDFGKESE